MTAVTQFFGELGREIREVSLTLFKLMIPVLVVVKLLEMAGLIDILSGALAPVMQWVGLPADMGLVWATTLMTNIYGGLVVLVNLDVPLTVAQASTLGVLLLAGHGLPVEAAIASKAGVRLWATLVVRIGGGLLLAWLLHLGYDQGGLLQQPAPLLWQPEQATDGSLAGWALVQLESLVMIQLIIIVLLFGLKLLKLLGIERLLAWLLRPLLRLLGISREATSLTLVGITLGLSFGGGLLINEARRGHVAPRDVFTAIMLLNLVHSLIEDTLLILLIGADFYSIFWGRLLFGLLVVGLITRGLSLVDEVTRQRYFYRPVAGGTD